MSNDDTRKPTPSWSDKMRDARGQARELRKKELEAALDAGDTEEIDRLTKAEDERVNGRRWAKLEAAKLKKELKLAAPRTNAVIWATTEEAIDWRAGKRPGGKRNTAVWYMSPGAMVRLVSDARVYTQGSWVMAKMLPKGTLGILIDATPSDFNGHVAVMFGAEIYRIECKKLRQIPDEDES
jgi:hypothetical protein